MNILLLFSVVIISIIIIFGIIAFYYQHENADQKFTDTDLDEWDCPECGFHIQAGLQCTYCYTKKPN